MMQDSGYRNKKQLPFEREHEFIYQVWKQLIFKIGISAIKKSARTICESGDRENIRNPYLMRNYNFLLKMSIVS
jgi:hypothetical protein